MQFEYDEAKNQANQLKHHVSFEEAKSIWDDPSLLILHAKKRGENRPLAIGKSLSAIFSVVHTNKSDVIRIISARRSTPKERRIYEQHIN